MHMPTASYLRFESVSKSFPGVRALDNVSLEIAEGTIHGIVGENGAGKSTLLNILNGVFKASSGTVIIDGKPAVFDAPRDAFNAGVAKIHQELFLIPEMTVAENIYLGHMPEKNGVIDKKKLITDTANQLKEIGEEIDPGAKVKNLSIAQRQMLEIAKALTRGAKIIAFDEPTSSLTSNESEKLFSMINRLKKQGKVIIYVTHRLDEIFKICDAITIMRDGRRIETYGTVRGLTHETIIEKMVGRSISDIYGYTQRKKGGSALEAAGITGTGLAEPVNINVSEGEILGVFGLVGAGRTELLRLIYGAEKRKTGIIRAGGCIADINSPAEAIDAGIMLCPEDRKKEGIVPVRSVQENINISARRNNLIAGLMLDEKWEEKNAADMIGRLRIKTPSAAQLINNLSGGNQQKTILARWLSEKIKVLLLDEPTRGIDVGAKSEIYSFIYKLAAEGKGIIMVSSDLPEVLGVADRIVVMCEGRVAGELARKEATEEKIMQLALPKTKQ
jgi:L-arabinose transport system ATP-binding protein